MSVGGKKVYDKSFYFRFIVICAAGMAAFAVLIGWRAQVLFNTEYIDVPNNLPQRLKHSSHSTRLNLIKAVNASDQTQN